MNGIKRIAIKKIINFIILLFFSLKSYSINLDDNRIDPFEGIEDFDGVVYVKIGDSVCTGALIDHRTIITAAHCLNAGTKAEIFTGNQIQEDDQPIQTTSFIKLPETKRYETYTGASYDLALISLKDPLLTLQPLKLNTNLPSLNQEVYISGFGLHGSGSVPDQSFDKKKRWGTNNLSIIADENVINGPSISTTPAKVILGFYFDEDKGSYESIISLGDSGSPLMIKSDDGFRVVGIASWVKKDSATQNRGYGASAGFSSINQNIEWLIDNNPLRQVQSKNNGDWSKVENWNDSDFPSNQYPSDEEYNSVSAKYYSVDILNQIDLKETVEIDSLKIMTIGNLILNENSSLSVLLDTQIKAGSIENKGRFKSSNILIKEGNFINHNDVETDNSISMIKGSLINNGTMEAQSVQINDGAVSGTGIFNSKSFFNAGNINPGNSINQLGVLTFNSHLKNDGTITIDISDSKGLDLLKINKFTIGGKLEINPVSNVYKGNSSFTFINFEEKEGLEFSSVDIISTNFGRLIEDIIYGDKSINLNLSNPSYELYATNSRSGAIGKYIDGFSKDTSLNLQNILDQINYLPEDKTVSDSIEDIVVTNSYNPFIQRLDMYQSNVKQGVYIDKSQFELNKNGLYFESTTNKFDINYFGVNLTYLNIDSDLQYAKSSTNSKSKAYDVSYRIPLSFLDIYISSYKEDKDTRSLRVMEINSSKYQGLHKRSIELAKQSIQIGKTFKTNYGKLGAGLSFSSLRIETNPFEETLNKMINQYSLEKIDMKITRPYISFSNSYKYGKNELLFGFNIRKSIYEENSYSTRINIDNAKSILTLDENLEINEDIISTIYFSNLYKDSIFGKISFSHKSYSEEVQLRLGYLF